jgi:hypothetical protein
MSEVAGEQHTRSSGRGKAKRLFPGSLGLPCHSLFSFWNPGFTRVVNALSAHIPLAPESRAPPTRSRTESLIHQYCSFALDWRQDTSRHCRQPREPTREDQVKTKPEGSFYP